jgi:hypothetical protein
MIPLRVYHRKAVGVGPPQRRVLPGRHLSYCRKWFTLCGNRSGDAAQALRLAEELLSDQVRVLGADHPETLVTRNSIAHWTGACGDPAQALRLYEELLPDKVRVLGPSDPEALRTHNNIAGLPEAQQAIGTPGDETGPCDPMRRGSAPA